MTDPLDPYPMPRRSAPRELVAVLLLVGGWVLLLVVAWNAHPGAALAWIGASAMAAGALLGRVDDDGEG